MTDREWLRAATDEETLELIRKVKDRGYAVIHRDAIRTIGAQCSYDKDRLLLETFPAQRLIRRELAQRAADFLSDSPDFPLREVDRGMSRITYETRFQWIGSRVSPEDSDYPLYLQRR